MKEITRRLFETIKGSFKAKDFITLPTIDTSGLMDIHCFSDMAMDKCSRYVTLDRDQLQFDSQNHNNSHC